MVKNSHPESEIKHSLVHHGEAAPLVAAPSHRCTSFGTFVFDEIFSNRTQNTINISLSLRHSQKATFRYASGRYLSLNCHTPQNVCLLDMINRARCYGLPDPNNSHTTMRNIDQTTILRLEKANNYVAKKKYVFILSLRRNS